MASMLNISVLINRYPCSRSTQWRRIRGRCEVQNVRTTSQVFTVEGERGLRTLDRLLERGLSSTHTREGDVGMNLTLIMALSHRSRRQLCYWGLLSRNHHLRRLGEASRGRALPTVCATYG